MTDVLALVEPALRVRLARYAAIASYFRGSLPRSLEDAAGLITARFLQAFVHEEHENKRNGPVHLYVGAFVEEDRDAPSQGGHVQVHSGKQLRATLTGVDIDGAAADVSSATAASSDEVQVTARIETNASGGVDLVITDVAGGNLGSATVTITVGDASAQENVEVIAGPAVAINIGAPVEEDRPA